MSHTAAFPTQLSAIPTAVLLDVYDQAASRVAQALAGLSSDEIRTRARGPERWSIGEIVCHLADSELVGAVRFRLVRSAPGTAMVAYDQDAFADLLGYDARDPRDIDTAWQTFASLRRSTGALFRSWRGDEWDLTGEHPDWGVVTLRQFLELYAEHGERHLDQILDTRNRLRRPMPLASILPDRLSRDITPSVPAGVGGSS